MSDVLARAAEVLQQALIETTGMCICDEAYTGRRLIDPDCPWHLADGDHLPSEMAQMLADAGLLAASAPVAGGNGAVSAEPCPPRPMTRETLDSLTARLMAARAATDGYRTEAERLRELLDEANAKIERMEEL